MTTITIDETNDIFACGGKPLVRVHNIQSPVLDMFHRNVSKLLGVISEVKKDEDWIPIVRGLKRFRFDISAAPLSQSNIKKLAEELYKQLQEKIYDLELMYGDEPADYLKKLVENLKQISIMNQDHLLDALVNFSRTNLMAKGAIVICEARLIPAVESSIEGITNLKRCIILSPMNLRDERCYERIVIFGSPRWFPEYVFSAPRTSDIHLLKYQWISGKWEPQNVFTSPFKYRGADQLRFTIDDSVVETSIGISDDLLPEIDIKGIEEKALCEARKRIDESDDDESDDIVRARLFVLEDDRVVFLEAEDNSRADVVDLDEETKKRVKRIYVREIELGMFILLRTEGGGDYIVPVADRIMGRFKNRARAAQQEWKRLLREKNRRHGLSAVVKGLVEHGSNRANDTNVRNWMSYRGIKTENREDFQAIMQYVGLGGKTNEYWKIMEEITRAHMRAGMEIRKMLLEKVNETNLDNLKKYGIMEFELAEKDAGKLAAFRVKVISKETTEVVYSKVGVPFKTDKY